jgi:hypothetical protein
VPILGAVDPLDRLRCAGKRVTDPLESLAQSVAQHVVDLVVHAVDLNALLQQVDLDALLARVDVNEVLARVDVSALVDRVDVSALVDRVDVNEVLRRVDVDALVSRVDVNAAAGRIDMDALVAQTDLGAVIAQSSGGMAAEALDAARSSAVGLDGFVDRWVGRVVRRRHPRPVAPPALLDAAGHGGTQA